MIGAEGDENEYRKRIGPQRIHPQRNDEHDFRGAVSQQIQRSEQPVVAQQCRRCAEYVDGDEVPRIVREFVLSKDLDNRVYCRGANEPEQQATDDFEHAVYAFERNASMKRLMESRPNSWLHRKMTRWIRLDGAAVKADLRDQTPAPSVGSKTASADRISIGNNKTKTPKRIVAAPDNNAPPRNPA